MSSEKAKLISVLVKVYEFFDALSNFVWVHVLVQDLIFVKSVQIFNRSVGSFLFGIVFSCFGCAWGTAINGAETKIPFAVIFSHFNGYVYPCQVVCFGAINDGWIGTYIAVVNYVVAHSSILIGLQLVREFN
jgi:hypothetical protein